MLTSRTDRKTTNSWQRKIFYFSISFVCFLSQTTMMRMPQGITRSLNALPSIVCFLRLCERPAQVMRSHVAS